MSFENAPPIRLQAGDFLLLRTSPPLKLSSELGVDCDGEDSSENELRYGDPHGDPNYRMLGGKFSIDPVNAASLLNLLPDRLHIRSSESDTSDLASLLRLITHEYFGESPGRDVVLERLLEVLLIESLRWYDLEAGAIQAGLLAGMHDPPIAQTLRAMHSKVNHGWTVAKLARHAGMSRSAYAKRFRDVVGCGPMEYLSRWRMCLAQDALARGSDRLEAIASMVGYRSATSFSNAFRRSMGCPPRAFSRSRNKTISN